MAINKVLYTPHILVSIIWFLVSVYQYGLLNSDLYLLFQYAMAIVCGCALGVLLRQFFKPSEPKTGMLKLFGLFVLFLVAAQFLFFHILKEFELRNRLDGKMALFAFKNFNEEAINPLDGYYTAGYTFTYSEFGTIPNCEPIDKNSAAGSAPFKGFPNLRSQLDNLDSESFCI